MFKLRRVNIQIYFIFYLVFSFTEAWINFNVYNYISALNTFIVLIRVKIYYRITSLSICVISELILFCYMIKLLIDYCAPYPMRECPFNLWDFIWIYPAKPTLTVLIAFIHHSYIFLSFFSHNVKLAQNTSNFKSMNIFEPCFHEAIKIEAWRVIIMITKD